MPWSAGNYTKGNAGSGGWTGDASLGIGIEAGRHDTQDNDFATGIDACIVKDGTNAFSGNVNLGNNRPININAGDASAPAVCVGSDTNTGIFGPAADTWAVATNGTERVRITSTGTVGINTTTPGATLDVHGATAVVNNTNYSTDTNGAYLLLNKSKTASVGTNTIVQSGDVLGQINFRGANGTGYTAAAAISAAVDGTPGATNDMPGRLLFYTTPDGSGTLTERMRITQDGKIGIGTNAPDYQLHVAGSVGKLYFGNTIEALDSGANNSGAIYFGLAPSSTTSPTGGIEASWGSSNTNPQISIGIIRDGNRTRTLYSTGTGMQFFVNNVEKARLKTDGEFITGGTTDNGAYNLQCNGTGVWGFGAYVNGSDAALKEDIAPIGNTLDIVKSLNPVMFRYKEEYSRDTNLQPGFIAQELEQVFANEVYKDGIVMQGPEFRSVAYQTLIPILVKSIQELNEKVDALTDRVAELEAA